MKFFDEAKSGRVKPLLPDANRKRTFYIKILKFEFQLNVFEMMGGVSLSKRIKTLIFYFEFFFFKIFFFIIAIACSRLYLHVY